MAEVSATTPILQLAGVRKAFGDAEVLHGIDLAVERGEVVAVLGPSGSGKTTLLRCANLLEHADAGELALDGVRFDLARVTAKEAAEIRRNTAFVFQSYNLFRNRTVLGNVTEGLVVAHRMPKDEAREIAVRCLERVGMATGSMPTRCSCPAVSSSALPSRVPWRRARKSSTSTSRLRRSIQS